ncbi:MAG: hypothetical protein IK028_01015 [Bacilli bacterium]|nr:hypothetical protein [Bacilli bacterium]
MKKLLLLTLIIPLLLVGCTDDKSDSTNKEPQKQVTLTFIQRPFLKISFDDDSSTSGYYFENKVIITTEIVYDKGYFLTKEDIDGLYRKIEYIIPPLNGDGYFSFTHYVTSFNEETGFASKFLKPMELNTDLTIHFGIYG